MSGIIHDWATLEIDGFSPETRENNSEQFGRAMSGKARSKSQDIVLPGAIAR
jgi:hypothetical protein